MPALQYGLDVNCGFNAYACVSYFVLNGTRCDKFEKHSKMKVARNGFT